jgi:hypothetical protein
MNSFSRYEDFKSPKFCGSLKVTASNSCRHVRESEWSVHSQFYIPKRYLQCELYENQD